MGLESDVRIVPIRQEQLKQRLGERFRELDIPLLLEWSERILTAASIDEVLH